MKKNVVRMSLVLLAVSFSLASCGSKKASDEGDSQEEVTQEGESQEMMKEEGMQEAPQAEESVQDSTQEVSEATSSDEGQGYSATSAYQCPMKCEGDKTYADPGKCPACNMEMEAVKV